MRDLTTGSIKHSIWAVAIPLILSSFIQMAYNMTDMIWLGHFSTTLGSGAEAIFIDGSACVAAVGVGGFFTWLCNSLSFIGKVGAEVTISQSLGARKPLRARIYANQAAMLSFLLSIVYALFIFFVSPALVGFFDLEGYISDMAVEYLKIVSVGIFFTFNNNTFTGLYNGQGDSKTPLKIVAIGLVLNMVLDPLLIFGWGPVPAMGTAGAGIATSMAQIIVFAIFVFRLYVRSSPLGHLRFLVIPRMKFTWRIAKLGIPFSMQSGLYAVISIILGSLAATFGYLGVSVQSIGAQIEAITWMTGAGFSTALATYVGQNYGAKDYTRIQNGYRYTLKLAMTISGIASVAFLFWGRELFGIFVSDEATLDAGQQYMLILALTQIFVSVENVTTGAFNGCGRTLPPALNGIIGNVLRIPLAWALVEFTSIGLNSIWITFGITSVLKGIILWILFYRFRRSGYQSLKEARMNQKRGRTYNIASRLWQQK